MNSNFLKSLFPFREIPDSELLEIQQELTFSVSEFEKNDVILSNEHYEREIGFVLSGKCEVRRRRLKEDILLQSLGKNDSFGILTLFSREEYPTVVISKGRTEVLFIPRDQFLLCLNRHPNVSMNVMTFLASRIVFLNKKIATLSGATVEEKVRQYIIFEYNSLGEQFAFNASRVAELLNIGRASLYRALDSLMEQDIISLSEKTIFIKRPDALKG